MYLPVLEDLLTAHVDGGMDGVSQRTRIHGPVGPTKPGGCQMSGAFDPDLPGHPLSEWAPLPLEQELGQ